ASRVFSCRRFLPCRIVPPARLSDLPCSREQPIRTSDSAVVKRRKECPLLGRAFSNRLVVAMVVVAGPGSLPAPRCRLPTPARAAIEADAGDKRRRGKGEEAGIMESMETSERPRWLRQTQPMPGWGVAASTEGAFTAGWVMAFAAEWPEGEA